jgi:hypothetical protein
MSGSMAHGGLGDTRNEGRREPRGGGRHGSRHTPTRIVLGVLTTLVTVNMWTGGPLLALWVGSRVQAAVGQLSMAAVAATVAVLIVETIVLYRLLAILSIRYDEAIGRTRRRQQAPWLKPMTGERRSIEVRQPLSAVERIVVTSVVGATLCLEVWFFFFAHYTLPVR